MIGRLYIWCTVKAEPWWKSCAPCDYNLLALPCVRFRICMTPPRTRGSWNGYFFSTASVGTLIIMTVQKMLGASSLASEVVVLLVARLAFQTGGRLSVEQMNIQQPEWIERAETRLLYDVDRDTVKKKSTKKDEFLRFSVHHHSHTLSLPRVSSYLQHLRRLQDH